MPSIRSPRKSAVMRPGALCEPHASGGGAQSEVMRRSSFAMHMRLPEEAAGSHWPGATKHCPNLESRAKREGHTGTTVLPTHVHAGRSCLIPPSSAPGKRIGCLSPKGWLAAAADRCLRAPTCSGHFQLQTSWLCWVCCVPADRCASGRVGESSAVHRKAFRMHTIRQVHTTSKKRRQVGHGRLLAPTQHARSFSCWRLLRQPCKRGRIGRHSPDVQLTRCRQG